MNLSDEELQTLKKINGVCTVAQCDLHCAVVIQSSKYCKCTIYFIYTKDAVHLQLQSSTLDSRLLQKITDAAKKYMQNSIPSTIISCTKYFSNVFQNNKLLTTWPEVFEIKKMDNVCASTIEKEGIVQCEIESNNYKLKITVTIPVCYPEEPPAFQVTESNFPRSILVIFEGLAVNLLKICSTQHKLQEDQVQKRGPSVKDLLEFRHDVKVLQKLADLKEVSHEKKFRRERTVLIRNEMELEKERQQVIIEKEVTSSITPMLLPLIQLFVDLVKTLTNLKCPVCKEFLLPKEPLQREKLETKPEITICNHWYHYECLHQYLTSPPFDTTKNCHYCSLPISHQKWNSEYINQCRKIYDHKMAKEREIADVIDTFL